jgi:hypothetical protein
MTLNEIRAKGLAVLLKELGPVGYVRFLQQFENGSGDYTKERSQWLDTITPEQLQELIEHQHQK